MHGSFYIQAWRADNKRTIVIWSASAAGRPSVHRPSGASHVTVTPNRAWPSHATPHRLRPPRSQTGQRQQRWGGFTSLLQVFHGKSHAVSVPYFISVSVPPSRSSSSPLPSSNGLPISAKSRPRTHLFCAPPRNFTCSAVLVPMSPCLSPVMAVPTTHKLLFQCLKPP